MAAPESAARGALSVPLPVPTRLALRLHQQLSATHRAHFTLALDAERKRAALAFVCLRMISGFLLKIRVTRDNRELILFTGTYEYL